MDREKGDGPEFAAQHRLRGQPGFVVYAPDGTLLRRELGPYNAEDLRELVRDLAENS